MITSSSTQGGQTNFIIFDSVISTANGLGDLSLAQDENLMNVVHTRARRGMMTLYHQDITTGTIAETWKEQKDKTGRGVFEANPLPYLIDIVNIRASMKQTHDKYAEQLIGKDVKFGKESKSTSEAQVLPQHSNDPLVPLFFHFSDQEVAELQSGISGISPDQILQEKKNGSALFLDVTIRKFPRNVERFEE